MKPKRPRFKQINYCYRCGAKDHLEKDCILKNVPQSQTGERRKRG